MQPCGWVGRWPLGMGLWFLVLLTVWLPLECCSSWSSVTSGKGLWGSVLGPGHTFPSYLAHLFPWSSGGWVPDAAPVVLQNAWLPRESRQPFHLLLCHSGCREPWGPLQARPRKGCKNRSVLGFPNDMERYNLSVPPSQDSVWRWGWGAERDRAQDLLRYFLTS